MLITTPNKVVAEVHDRMPVILEAKDFEQWERGTVADASALLKPAHDEPLRRWPVSKRVNSSRTSDDDETLILPEEIGLEADAAALMKLMDDPENFAEIADLLGQNG
jgi:putative SOS response-associated peptidase YedK